MAEFIDIRDLYTSIASSVDDANRLLEKAAEDAEFSYAITELDFSVPFKELMVEEGRVEISLAKENDGVSEVRSLRFKVRFVPRTTVQKVEEEESAKPGAIVPDLLNTTLDDATAKIKGWGLEVGNVSYDRTKRPAGHVVSQIPVSLTRAESGAKVDLVIAGEAPKPKRKKKAPPKSTEQGS